MGYYKLGKIGWPTPSAIVMEDRATGTLYLLSHDSSTDTLVLTTPVPTRANARPSEPLVGFTPYPQRLYVEDGELLWEDVATNERTRVDPPVYTLNFGDRRTTYQLYGGTDPLYLCLKKHTSLGLTEEITDLGCVLALVRVFEAGVFESGVFD